MGGLLLVGACRLAGGKQYGCQAGERTESDVCAEQGRHVQSPCLVVASGFHELGRALKQKGPGNAEPRIILPKAVAYSADTHLPSL